MTTYSRELETVLRKYIDSWKGKGRDRLRELLKNESVDARRELLMNVKEGVFGTWTGLHGVTYADDLETIKYMFNNFSANQKCDVVKIQDYAKYTALHTAAELGHTSIMNYLLSNLSQQQKYDLLKIQTRFGDTPLHIAADNKKGKTVQVIISSVSSPLLIQLLNIKNNKGQTVADIRREVHDEVLVLISQGMMAIYFTKLPIQIVKYIISITAIICLHVCIVIFVHQKILIVTHGIIN